MNEIRTTTVLLYIGAFKSVAPRVRISTLKLVYIIVTSRGQIIFSGVGGLPTLVTGFYRELYVTVVDIVNK